MGSLYITSFLIPRSIPSHVLGFNTSIAIKLIERLGKDDDYRFEAFDREEKIYHRLEQAVAEGGRVIAPRFLGRYRNKFMEVIGLELLGNALQTWSELTEREK